MRTTTMQDDAEALTQYEYQEIFSEIEEQPAWRRTVAPITGAWIETRQGR